MMKHDDEKLQQVCNMTDILHYLLIKIVVIVFCNCHVFLPEDSKAVIMEELMLDFESGPQITLLPLQDILSDGMEIRKFEAPVLTFFHAEDNVHIGSAWLQYYCTFYT